MTRTLHLLSAGAAKGLVEALQPAFEAAHGCRLRGRFGAVGAMSEALRAGEPCDLMISSVAQLDALVADGRLRPGAPAALGRVRTGIAVPTRAARPDVATPEGLRAALQAADAIFFPDPERATAGIHFARVMRELGLADELAPRWRVHPNGATAMAELARCGLPGAIGCTQVTEIRYTPGVDLVAPLPPCFELATAYGAAEVIGAAEADLARALMRLLAAPEQADLRAAGGFEA